MRPGFDDPVYLTLGDVLAIYAVFIGFRVEQAEDHLRDSSALQGALARPATYAHYQEADIALQATVLAGVARFEVRRKSSRSDRVAKARRSAGHPPAGRVTYGYGWVPVHARDEAGTRYRLDPEEARVVRWMFT